ncbi:unnamed protein product [Adineta steineri]|uniref:Uncharacterized protein n=1 Tax=Adineta steineri TaxID=433720 RepID=A0A814FJP6_9BILA|nr:unnamed protein product [Adineta steineri]
MQTKTLLALFCTIVVLFIDVNDGAPAVVKKPTVVGTTAASVPSPNPAKLAGAPTPWSTTIDAKSKKIFNSHIKIISKKLNAVHKVDKKFKPKPVKVQTQLVSGMLYRYLVQLPNKKYALVTVGVQAWKKSKVLDEKMVNVREKLYDLNDKDL